MEETINRIAISSVVSLGVEKSAQYAVLERILTLWV